MQTDGRTDRQMALYSRLHIEIYCNVMFVVRIFHLAKLPDVHYSLHCKMIGPLVTYVDYIVLTMYLLYSGKFSKTINFVVSMDFTAALKIYSLKSY